MAKGNPNHPVTRAMDGNWHKVTAMLMKKQGIKEFEITEPMTMELAKDPCNIIVADTRGGGLIIRLVTEAEGRALMKAEGLQN